MSADGGAFAKHGAETIILLRDFAAGEVLGEFLCTIQKAIMVASRRI